MHAILKSALFSFALISLAPPIAASESSDAPSPLAGTWKLDPNASKFTSGMSMQSETRTYEVKGNRVKMTSTGIDGAGKPTKYSYEAAYDGKFYPMIGNPAGDSLALKRIDPRTVEGTVKKGAVVSAHAKLVVSPDGKHMMFTRKILRPKAKPAVDELAYDKQP
jgi:hypothetical protein